MNSSRIKTRAASFTTAFLACVGAACAQPVSTSSSSVEWLGANSPLIVRAVIDDIAVHDPDDSFNRYQTVSVRVLETVKGTHADRLQFVHNWDFGAFRLSKLQQDKQEVLLFLDRWSQSRRFNRSTGGYAYARFPYLVEHAAILTPADVRFAETSVPPLTGNLTKLSTPNQLVDAIKTYLKARRGQQPVRGVTIELPPHLRGGFYRVDFTFPADANLDQPQTAVEEPAADFATLKERFAKNPPAEKKPPYARSRSGYSGVSALELMAADCDVIVRGVIENSCFIAATDGPTGPSCGVKLRVLETFKGKAPQHVNVYVTDGRDLEHLMRDQQEMVVFLRNQSLSGPAAVFGHQTRGGLWDDSVIILNPRDAEVLFADLSWQRQPEKVLNRLRVVTERERREQRASRTDDGPPRPLVFDVHPPASIAAGSSIAGNDHSRIYLPVDRDLEANARHWAAADSNDLRWLAARAMIYFKSDRNAALLQTLLVDNATWSRLEILHLIHPLNPEDNPEFLVRWEAWHVLDGWGCDVRKPSFRAGPRTNR